MGYALFLPRTFRVLKACLLGVTIFAAWSLKCLLKAIVALISVALTTLAASLSNETVMKTLACYS